MQALVYIFISITALCIGVAAYFGLSFTPAEAVLVAIVAGFAGVLVMERRLRRRSELRLERAIEGLSRLLSTDAQAGAALSQRVNALADEDAGKRLEAVEADISVLGTVIRQVAEAVADIEQRNAAPNARHTSAKVEPIVMPQSAPVAAAPEYPAALLQAALSENRIVHHVQPVVTLPQRRVHGYDLLPRLIEIDGAVIEAQHFMPRRDGDAIRCRIEMAGLLEAVTLTRRARSGGQPLNLFVPLSRASLSDAETAEELLTLLDANRVVAENCVFHIAFPEWLALASREQAVAAQLVTKGATFSLDAVNSLRGDMRALAAAGVRSLRVDGADFIADPASYTDYQPADVVSYLSRFDIDLIATNIAGEGQILELLEDGIGLAVGPHIAAPLPARADLFSERPQSPAHLRQVGR